MHVVIVGGGLAGATTAAELRRLGHTGDITLLAEERHLPYERPPLSKSLLLGDLAIEAAADEVAVNDAGWYADHQIDLRTSARATGLDLDRRHVLTDGGELAFDRLVLATGSVARRLPALEEQAAAVGLPVVRIRTLDDALEVRRAVDDRPGGHLLVVGAGWLGLEVAAAVRTRGWAVTVTDPAPAPLHAVLGPELGAVFADLHRGHGVDLRLGATVDDVRHGSGGRSVVTLADGHAVLPDLVLVAVGAVPRTELAAAAGLEVEGGVRVDPWLRTTDPAVLAVGDVALHDHPVLGLRVRVEHWDTAIAHGRAAAAVALGGDEPCSSQPYFFSDQYDVGMEYLGHVPPGADPEVVVRRSDDPHVLTAFWLDGRRVLAGAHLGDWDAMDAIRGIVGRDVDADALRDAGASLDEVGRD